MDFQEPQTLLTAWVLVPALVAILSAGLGHGIALLSGLSLRALTLPAGFLTGITVFTVLFHAGITGKWAVAILLLAAAAGPAYSVLKERSRARPERGVLRRWSWAGLAALIAYGAALAPLAGSGRSGVVGYVLNDDSAVHVTVMEAVADGATDRIGDDRDSYENVSILLDTGYPVGSYAWPVLGRIVGGIEVFHLWSPLIAFTLAMLALVVYSVLRHLAAPRPYAAGAAVLVSSGHLLYAFNAQGSAKELIVPVAVYATAGLLVLAIQSGTRGRTILPAGIASAAAVAALGFAAVAWIAPLVLAAAAVLVWRHLRGRRIANVRNLLLYVSVAGLLALPAAITSLDLLRKTRREIGDPADTGNLIDAVSPWQLLNVWLTGDYRFKPTELPGFTYTALVLALLLAVCGVVQAVRRKRLELPLMLLAGFTAMALITPATSIYYDAKTYVVLAAGLGTATAAGVLLLWTGALRALAVAVAGTVAVGIAWSAVLIYQHAWVTPETRLGELSEVAERFDGQGRILIVDREQYAQYFLRDLGPWDDWGYNKPHSGLRVPGGVRPALPRTPDLDDYTLEHLHRFNLLLERKRPGGSRAVMGFDPVFETQHYRVWKRTGPLPREHVPFGRDGQEGSAQVECRGGRPRSTAVRALAGRARRLGVPLTAALVPAAPTVAIPYDYWLGMDVERAVPAPETRAGRRGAADSKPLRIPPGRYSAWIQGSFGPGVRLYVRSPGEGDRLVGDVFNDLGAPGWHRFGVIDVRRGTVLHAFGIDRPWYLSGSRHFNIAGPLELVPEGAESRIETIPPTQLARLCGRHLDWLAIRA